MATYNGGKFIRDQISSILCQLADTDEIVITDDQSSDNTLDIINSFHDSRIKLFINESRLGYTKNFEKAITHSKGDYIFLSDQDDVWLPGRVDKMIKKLSDYHLVFSNGSLVDGNLENLGVTIFQLRGGMSGFLRNFIKVQYIGLCIAFRRTILIKLLPFPTRSHLCPHDMWIALISEFYYSTSPISEQLILYRRHEHNASNGGFKAKNSYYKMFKFRLYSMVMVVSRYFR
jgi:glycosyltransferase involved in cell wall biosynthesis